jgi:hypothetical protein
MIILLIISKTVDTDGAWYGKRITRALSLSAVPIERRYNVNDDVSIVLCAVESRQSITLETRSKRRHLSVLNNGI